MSLSQKLKHHWPQARSPEHYILWQDGISWWDSSVLGEEPSMQDLEALPDHPPAPDWASFRLALVQSPAYLRITSAAPNALVALLTNIAFLIDSQPEKAIELAAIWNAIASIAQPTEAEITALNAIGTATNVPFVLSEAGIMG